MPPLFGVKAKIKRTKRIADPDQRAGTLLLLGSRYLDAGRLNSAFECFSAGYREATESGSGERPVRLVAAYCAAHASHIRGLKWDFVIAKIFAQSAIEQAEDYAKGHEMMGKAEFGLGHFQAAKEELLLALKLNSEADEFDPGINQGIATFMTNVQGTDVVNMSEVADLVADVEAHL